MAVFKTLLLALAYVGLGAFLNHVYSLRICTDHCPFSYLPIKQRVLRLSHWNLLPGLYSRLSNHCLVDILMETGQDPELDVTVGVVLPPVSTPPSSEYIVQIVAPVTNGYTGVSMGGQMANSLLFTLWPNGNKIMLGARWAE